MASEVENTPLTAEADFEHHIDLRVDRALGVYLKHHDYTMDEWKTLQTAGDFPPKRRKELATLRPDTKLTVSGGGLGWADLDAWRPWNVTIMKMSYLPRYVRG